MAGHVFLSHGRGQDSRFARAVVGFLGEAGIVTWVDSEYVTAERWDQEVRPQVDSCSVFVVVMSPDSEKSGWVHRELDRAIELGKPVLPLLLSGAPFPELRNSWFDDVTGGHMPRPDFVNRLRVLQQAYNPATQATVIGEIPPYVQPDDPTVYSGRNRATTFSSGRSADLRRRRGRLRGLGAVAVWCAFAVAIAASLGLLYFGGLGRPYLQRIDRPDAQRWVCAQPGLVCEDRDAPYGLDVTSPDGPTAALPGIAGGVAVAVLAGLLAGLLMLPRWIRITAALPAVGLAVEVALDARHAYSTNVAYLGVAAATMATTLLAYRGALGWGQLASGTRRYPALVGAFAAGGVGAVLAAALLLGMAIAFDVLDGTFKHTNMIDHSGHVLGFAALAAAAGGLAGTVVALLVGTIVVAVRRRLSPRGQITPSPGTARRLVIGWGVVLAACLAILVGVGLLGLRHGIAVPGAPGPASGVPA